MGMAGGSCDCGRECFGVGEATADAGVASDGVAHRLGVREYVVGLSRTGDCARALLLLSLGLSREWD